MNETKSMLPDAAESKVCAICGTNIEGEAQALRGIYGSGWRHVDVMACRDAEYHRFEDGYE